MSGALGSESGQHGSDDIQRSEEVGLHAAPDLVGLAFFDGPDQSVACVVDHHIQGAKALDGRIKGGVDLVFVGDVQSEREGLLRNDGCEGLDGGNISSGQHHPVACLEGCLGDGATEPGRTAGDEPGSWTARWIGAHRRVMLTPVPSPANRPARRRSFRTTWRCLRLFSEDA
jgi:hypothetical protein